MSLLATFLGAFGKRGTGGDQLVATVGESDGVAAAARPFHAVDTSAGRPELARVAGSIDSAGQLTEPVGVASCSQNTKMPQPKVAVAAHDKLASAVQNVIRTRDGSVPQPKVAVAADSKPSDELAATMQNLIRARFGSRYCFVQQPKIGVTADAKPSDELAATMQNLIGARFGSRYCSVQQPKIGVTADAMPSDELAASMQNLIKARLGSRYCSAKQSH